jgi:hypothetical protein
VRRTLKTRRHGVFRAHSAMMLAPQYGAQLTLM